jgi:hypothetical protein
MEEMVVELCELDDAGQSTGVARRRRHSDDV